MTPAKPMIEFSRKHQEDKLAHEQQEELRELTEDEADLEVGSSSPHLSSKGINYFAVGIETSIPELVFCF